MGRLRPRERERAQDPSTAQPGQRTREHSQIPAPTMTRLDSRTRLLAPPIPSRYGERRVSGSFKQILPALGCMEPWGRAKAGEMKSQEGEVLGTFISTQRGGQHIGNFSISSPHLFFFFLFKEPHALVSSSAGNKINIYRLQADFSQMPMPHQPLPRIKRSPELSAAAWSSRRPLGERARDTFTLCTGDP